MSHKVAASWCHTRWQLAGVTHVPHWWQLAGVTHVSHWWQLAGVTHVPHRWQLLVTYNNILKPDMLSSYPHFLTLENWTKITCNYFVRINNTHLLARSQLRLSNQRTLIHIDGNGGPAN